VLLMHHGGQLDQQKLRRTGIRRQELLSNSRSHGVVDIDKAIAPALEPSGKLSVPEKDASHPADESH
jgi:uncharacterized membrane protein YcaP (DUF421 family)